MTEHHPDLFLAAIVAILTAVTLGLAGMPAPWPPAIALYVYGAWQADPSQDQVPIGQGGRCTADLAGRVLRC